jgi:hypothetical protein
MYTVVQDDDFFHRVPLTSKAVLVWKENIYINAFDPKAEFVCVHHFSIEPESRKGFFNCVYKYGKEIEEYSNLFRIPGSVTNNQTKISDGRLSFEVIDPLKQLKVVFKGKKFTSELNYTGRFAVFDYRQDPLSPGYSPLFELGRRALPYNHQEQGLKVRGSVTLNRSKKKLDIDGVANRDHSWGLRNEAVFDWHYWTGAHFDNWFSNWCLISDKLCEPPEKHGGFISSASGNLPITRIEVTERPEKVKNLAKLEEVEYRLEDADGGSRTLVFDAKNAIGPVFFPNVPVEPTIIYEMADWWGKYTVKETGEVGKGLTEIAKLRKTTKKDRYAR